MKDITETISNRSPLIIKASFIALLFILAMTSKGSGQTPQARGLEIAIEMDKRDSGFADMKANMKMILRNRQGEESI